MTFSIITVCLNAVDDLKATLLSVGEQVYQDFEHIVVDGGSRDGTQELLAKHSGDNSRIVWISEPDEGLYDAMNKGIDRVRGDWIIFLNAGDMFFSKRTLEVVRRYLREDDDIVYGSYRILDGNGGGRIRFSRKDPSLLWKSMGKITSHNAMFFSADFLKAREFDLRYRICADNAMVYPAYRSGAGFRRIGLVVAAIAPPSVSAEEAERFFENRKICLENGPTLSMRLFFLIRVPYYRWLGFFSGTGFGRLLRNIARRLKRLTT